MLYDGKNVIGDKKSDENLFHYREDQQTRRKVYVRMREPHDSLLDKEPREFKVRLIENLSGLEMELAGSGSNSNTNNKSYSNKSTVNFDKLKHLDIKVLERINRGYFIRVIRLIFKKMLKTFTSDKSQMLVNKLDAHGMNLTHYIVCLDYYELVPDLYRMGANLALPTKIPNSTKNMVPIVICSAKGFQNTLSELMKYVSMPYHDEQEVRLNEEKSKVSYLSPISHQNKDNDSDEEEHKSVTTEGPLEVAFRNKQHEILELLLRDMTLQKALNTDNCSEHGEIEPKYQEMLKNFYNTDHEHTQENHELLKCRLIELCSTEKARTSQANQSQRRDQMSTKMVGSLATDSINNEDSEDDDSYFIKNARGYRIEVITDEIKASNNYANPNMLNNRNLSISYDKASFNNKSKIK